MPDDALYKFYNNYMCWLREAAFRKNDSVVDESNDAGDTGFRLPGRFITQPLIYIKRNKVFNRVANNIDWGYIGHHGYQEGKMILEVEMIDLSLLYYLCKGCTTTDDTPSAGKYTHVFATTTGRATTKPSFAIYQRVTNADTDNNIYWLYTGCILHSVTINIPLNGPVTLSLDIRFANVVTATALSSEPTFGSLKSYIGERTSFAYKIGGVAYTGSYHGGSITYNDGTILHKECNELYAGEILYGPRDINFNLEFTPKQIEVMADQLTAPLAPETASDVDCTIKMYRNTTNDYTEFAFEKIWCVNAPEGIWDFQIEDGVFLNTKPKFILKPVSFEAGAKLTITEVNALDDDRYET